MERTTRYKYELNETMNKIIVNDIEIMDKLENRKHLTEHEIALIVLVLHYTKYQKFTPWQQLSFIDRLVFDDSKLTEKEINIIKECWETYCNKSMIPQFFVLKNALINDKKNTNDTKIKMLIGALKLLGQAGYISVEKANQFLGSFYMEIHNQIESSKIDLLNN